MTLTQRTIRQTCTLRINENSIPLSRALVQASLSVPSSYTSLKGYKSSARLPCRSAARVPVSSLASGWFGLYVDATSNDQWGILATIKRLAFAILHIARHGSLGSRISPPSEPQSFLVQSGICLDPFKEGSLLFVMHVQVPQ